VLGREGEIFAAAAQVEVGVAPGVELGGARRAWPARMRPAPFLA
jgi:hypothetical protein